jgi:Flp pilus assembly protein TadD
MMKLRNRKQRNDLAATILKSRELLVEGRHQENFEILQQAVQRFPEDPEIRLLYATTLIEFHPEEVASEAAKAVALGPDNASILVRGGSLLLHRGDREAARSCVERAARLAPPDFALAGGLENLEGSLAALAGQDDLAEEKLRGAVGREPGNEPFARNLAVFLAERGRLREGAEVLNEALKHVGKQDVLEQMRDRMAAEADSQ